MKKVILFLAILVAGSSAIAQNAKQDASGNYIAIKADTSTAAGKETGKTFTDNKGVVYKLLESSKGKLFYMRTSKAGNVYKCYLKLAAL